HSFPTRRSSDLAVRRSKMAARTWLVLEARSLMASVVKPSCSAEVSSLPEDRRTVWGIRRGEPAAFVFSGVVFIFVFSTGLKVACPVHIFTPTAIWHERAVSGQLNARQGHARQGKRFSI